MGNHYKFISYHPYLTFSGNKTDKKRFIKEGGKPSVDSDLADFDDVLSLWLLGKEAYSAFPPFESKEFFDDAYKGYLAHIDDYRECIKNKAGITFIDALTGEASIPDFERLSDSDILGCIMAVLEHGASYTKEPAHELVRDTLKECFLMSCLRAIDDAIMTASFGAFGGAHYVLEAATAFANYKALESKNVALQKARSELALRAAGARHAENRARKQEAFNWLDKNRESYTSDAKTAEAMMPIFGAGFPAISGWIRDWRKG